MQDHGRAGPGGALGDDVVAQGGQEAGRQVGERDAGGQVDGVHPHLAGAQPGHLGGGHGPALGGHDGRLPPLLAERGHPRLQRLGRTVQPRGEFGGRQGAAPFDARRAFLRRGVHRRDLAGGGPVHQVGEGLGVGGDVGGHVPAGPAGQEARGVEAVLVETGGGPQQPLGAVPGPPAGVAEGPAHRPAPDLTTRFSRRPMPSISVTTVSPPTR